MGTGHPLDFVAPFQLAEETLVVDPSQHADSRNLVESILRYIPGFKGYLEKEYRRDSDYLARTHLGDQLRKCKSQLDHYQRALVESAALDELPKCERLRTRVDTLESRIRGAVRGYSGFFDFVRVNEAVLDDVYDHDMALLTDVATLLDATGRLSTTDTANVTVDDLLQQVEDLHSKFDGRTALLEGLDEKS
ncbi:MAG: hypothetical protein CMJ50_01905 [Planctomycetaceae bacterium]|jgi:hypothetical protein|nr:hypothetical protein [Planctomycetaceae bacterium]